MWTNENRFRYDRSRLRYPSDLTDAEWAFIAPVIPPARRGGGKRTVSIREVVNGLMYVLSTGCQWCKTACKYFQILECAPDGGQNERIGLTL